MLGIYTQGTCNSVYYSAYPKEIQMSKIDTRTKNLYLVHFEHKNISPETVLNMTEEELLKYDRIGPLAFPNIYRIAQSLKDIEDNLKQETKRETQPMKCIIVLIDDEGIEKETLHECSNATWESFACTDKRLFKTIMLNDTCYVVDEVNIDIDMNKVVILVKEY